MAERKAGYSEHPYQRVRCKRQIAHEAALEGAKSRMEVLFPCERLLQTPGAACSVPACCGECTPSITLSVCSPAAPDSTRRSWHFIIIIFFFLLKPVCMFWAPQISVCQTLLTLNICFIFASQICFLAMIHVVLHLKVSIFWFIMISQLEWQQKL